MIGVYKIINKINGKMYIGSSINILQRWSKHKALLRYNKHSNKHLQNSWNKHGEEAFEFSIIEECKENELLLKEQYYLNLELKANEFYKDGGKLFYSLGYNLQPICDGSNINDDIKLKISETLKLKYNNKEIDKTNNKKCYQYNRFNGELIKIWDVINDANRHYNTPNNTTSKIQRCLWNKIPSAYDSVWSFKPIEFIWASGVSSRGNQIFSLDCYENTYSFYSSKSELLSVIRPGVKTSSNIITKYENSDKLLYNRYKIISLGAPIIYDGKPFELLGYREDLITKTSEEILNGKV